MDSFIIIQRGVYRHAIHGVFDDLSIAEGAARDIARADDDDYHTYVVGKIARNVRVDDVVAVSEWCKVGPRANSAFFRRNAKANPLSDAERAAGVYRVQ